MYVPGKLVDVNNVIIDIGTRYYAQKVSVFIIKNLKPTSIFSFQDIEAGKDYFKRKINFVTEQMEKIQVLGLEKSKIRDAVVEVMELKMQNQAAAQCFHASYI